MNRNWGGKHEIAPAPDLSEADKARFWSKVALTANPDRCWIWLGSKRSKKPGRDYGQFFLSKKGKESSYSAHRISFLIMNETYPEKILLHSCDTPSCVNPRHLFDGTNKENTRDMLNKGRHIAQKGSEHHHAKLTEADILVIRVRFKSGDTQQTLAKDYNVCSSNISNIVLRKYWKHI